MPTLTDWQEACDPVPVRKARVATAAAAKKLRAKREQLRTANTLRKTLSAESVIGVDPDFDKDGF